MKKLFTNDRFFLIAVITATFGVLFSSACYINYVTECFSSFISLFLCLICVISLYISYKKHSKNVMKGMMGALVAAIVFFAASLFSVAENQTEKVFFLLFFGCSLLMFLNHFLINADHHPSPENVIGNQVVATAMAVMYAVWNVYNIVSVDALADAACIMDVAGFAGIVASLVCVESRLDAYRIDRELAGWTEKNGYPDGYLHESDKK